MPPTPRDYFDFKFFFFLNYDSLGPSIELEVDFDCKCLVFPLGKNIESSEPLAKVKALSTAEAPNFLDRPGRLA
jgi:hypothetical protein